MGLPMTPTSRRPGLASARAPSMVTTGPTARVREATALGQLLVGQLLGVRVGEGHGAVFLDQHEVQPRPAGGWTAAFRASWEGMQMGVGVNPLLR